MHYDLFRREDRKYSALWQANYSDANWRKLAAATLKKVHMNGNKPVLVDFGFGTGNAMEFFEQRGFYVEGVDISSHAVENQLRKGKLVHHASLDSLPMLSDNEFSIGFCNDVLEHIPETLVQQSLDEMARTCSDYLFISVCPTPSDHLSLAGENLHLTVKPTSWWEAQFQKYGQVERLKFWFSRSARYSISLETHTAVH